MMQAVRNAVASHQVVMLVVHGRRGRGRRVLLLIRLVATQMVLVHHFNGHHGLVRRELVQIHHAAHIIAFGEKLFRVNNTIGHQVLFDIAWRATSWCGACHLFARVELVQVVGRSVFGRQLLMIGQGRVEIACERHLTIEHIAMLSTHRLSVVVAK